MKKLITVIAICMMAYALPAAAESSKGSTATGTGEVKNTEKNMTPEQRVAKIEERIKKLEEHKARASGNGRTEVVSALQGMIDALNNLKGVAGSKDRESIKGAMEKVKTARAALEKAAPRNAKENCSKPGGDKAGKTQNKNSL